MDNNWKTDLAYASAWWSQVPLVNYDTCQTRDAVIKYSMGKHLGNFENLLVRAYRAGVPHRWDKLCQDYDNMIKTGINLRREMIERKGECFANEHNLSHQEQAGLLGKLLAEYCPNREQMEREMV